MKPVLFRSHDFFEIYFFLDGKVTYYIENEVYTLEKGDVLVIPPGKLHRPVIEENVPYERCVLWLYSHYLSICEGAGHMVGEITRMISEKNTRRVHFEGEKLRIMRGLFDRLLSDFESGKELAAKFFVSKYYLSHQFKEHTKTTIHQYILMKKINLAKELLEKGSSPQEVSDNCGFTTYANFYKAFTRMTGMSPRDYRKMDHICEGTEQIRSAIE